MPGEIRAAVDWAVADDEVHVIVVEGAGKGFCGGYDLAATAEQHIEHPCQQESAPWDPALDYRTMKRYTEDFMSELWKVLASYSARAVVVERQRYTDSRFNPDDIEFTQTCVNDPDDRERCWGLKFELKRKEPDYYDPDYKQCDDSLEDPAQP